MSRYHWVKESGTVQEKDIKENLLSCANAGMYFLAYCTDSFHAGHGKQEEIEEVEMKNLLEFRLFSRKDEYCFRRSHIGEEFHWRLASEENLKKEEFFIRHQTLDLNQEKTKKEGNRMDSFGRRIVYSTVGGRYQLPISGDEDSVRIIAYVCYDDQGMAKIVDYRVSGFVVYESLITTGKEKEK